MRFLLITLIAHAPDPVTGTQPTTTQRFSSAVTTLSLLDPVRAFEDYATLGKPSLTGAEHETEPVHDPVSLADLTPTG
jgi:hypothetical protein